MGQQRSWCSPVSPDQIRACSDFGRGSVIFPYLSVLTHHLYLLIYLASMDKDCLFVLCLCRAKSKWAQHPRQVVSLSETTLPQLETEKRHECEQNLMTNKTPSMKQPAKFLSALLQLKFHLDQCNHTKDKRDPESC